MKRELAMVGVTALVVLALLVAPLSTPYWWDEGAVYAPGAKWLLDHGFDARPGVFPADLSRGHTSLFYLLVAFSYRVLGAGPVAGHLVTFAFAWMAVVFTYALARRLFGFQAGAVAAVLLVASPLFQTIASMTLPEMALTALVAASFYAFARGRIAVSAALGTVLVLVKETGVACPLAIAGAIGLEAILRRDRGGIRRTAIALVPVLALAVFFAVQKRAEGWFVLPYHAGLFHEEHSLVDQLGRVAESIFVADGRFIAMLAAIGLAAWRRDAFARAWREHREVLVAFASFAVMNLGFFAKMFFLERYVLPVHVCACVAIGGCLAIERPRWPGLAAAAVAIIVAFARRSAGTDMASGETNFRYLHAVHAQEALFHRLESAGGDPRVLSDWPVTDELRYPFLGWVHRPFLCEHIGEEGSKSPEIDRVIAVQGLGSYERLQREARKRGFSLLDRAEEGGAAIELWGQPGTRPASVSTERRQP